MKKKMLNMIYLTDIDFYIILKDYFMDFFHIFYRINELFLSKCRKLLPKED